MAPSRKSKFLVSLMVTGTLLGTAACGHGGFGDDDGTSAAPTTVLEAEPAVSDEPDPEAEAEARKAEVLAYSDAFADAWADIPGPDRRQRGSDRVRICAPGGSPGQLRRSRGIRRTQCRGRSPFRSVSPTSWDEAIASCEAADSDSMRDMVGVPSDGVAERCSLWRAFEMQNELYDVVRELKNDLNSDA